jgi:predicted DNA-binding transcriptional regulator AlpA
MHQQQNAVAPEDRLIGTEEVAAMLGCHLITLYHRVKSDPELPKPIRGVNGRRLKWREADIRAYVARKEAEGWR